MCALAKPAVYGELDDSNVVLRPIHPPHLRGTAGCETWSVSFSPDGSHFAWSMGYGHVKVFQWPLINDNRKHGDEGAFEKTLNCDDFVWGLAFGPRPFNKSSGTSPNQSGHGLLLATGLNNGVIKVWGVATGSLLFSLCGHESVVRDLAFIPNGSLTLVSASRDKTIRIWDLSEDGKMTHVLTGPAHWILKCSISPDSSMVACVCHSDSKVYLWSLRSYTFMRNLTYDQPRTMVSCDFSPDGALLAIGSYDSKSWRVELWDPHTAELLAYLADRCDMCGHRYQNLIRALDFSPVGLLLALVTDQKALQIWDPELDELVTEYSHHRADTLCCTFHPDGGTIATGTRDGHVKFWKVPVLVPSLRHLCRSALRYAMTTHQVEVLPLPKKILGFLTLRDILKSKDLSCSSDCS